MTEAGFLRSIISLSQYATSKPVLIIKKRGKKERRCVKSCHCYNHFMNYAAKLQIICKMTKKSDKLLAATIATASAATSAIGIVAAASATATTVATTSAASAALRTGNVQLIVGGIAHIEHRTLEA